ncbi:hypothetical protein [Bradyrhizobium japonicum]|nr:hypothetical protein [Bradyrhizobium japonicum]MCD9817623.1 hypothetical protein [Bradyrhizobium japonicum]MEB2672534.1 hypothetical protein [Bradyrhizobium japonicum]WRI91795.1 hypothetical protein R3F75_13045 [Bradyrhizobium japonicum]
MTHAPFWGGGVIGLLCGGSFGAIIMAIIAMGMDSDFATSKGGSHDPRK